MIMINLNIGNLYKTLLFDLFSTVKHLQLKCIHLKCYKATDRLGYYVSVLTIVSLQCV